MRRVKAPPFDHHHLHQGGNDCSISDLHQGLCRDAPPLLPPLIHHRGRLRGQEVKSSKRRHREGEGKFEKKKKKAPEEVQHPVLNQGCFLKKLAFPLSRLSHLVTTTSSKFEIRRKKEGFQLLLALNFIIKKLKGNIKSLLVKRSTATKRMGEKNK